MPSYNETIEIGMKPEKAPNGGLADATNIRKKKADTARQAYGAQSSKEDKILFYLTYCAKNTVNQNTVLPITSIEVPYGISEDEKNSMIDKANDDFNKAMAARKKAGMNPLNVTSEEEDDCQEDLKNRLLMDLIGDGSREFIMDSVKAFAIVNAWNINNQGKKYKEILDKLPVNEPNREKKALYLTYKSQGHEAMLNGAISNFSSMGLVSAFGYGDEIGEAVKEKVYENLHYKKETTTFRDFFDKLGFTADERKLYLAGTEYNEDVKLYDYYRDKLMGEGNEAPSDEDILDSVREDYTSEFAKMFINSAMKGPVDYFKSKYNEYMTVNHYMNILKLDDEKKKDFLAHYNAKETDSLAAILRNYIDSHEEIKQQIMDENEKDGKEREITADNIAAFAEKLLSEEFAGKRSKLKAFDEKYSPLMTVGQYMEILDIDDIEKGEFLSSYDVGESSKLVDIMSKELMAEKAAKKEEQAAINEEIKLYTRKKLEEQIDEQIASAKYVKDKSIWGNMYVHFADGMKIPGDILIYKQGHVVNGGEGLVPKNNPKTASQKEFKEWVEKVASKQVEATYCADQIDSFKKSNEIVSNKKAINLRNDDFVADYFDSVTPVSNTTFLRGAITALENTKTGKKWTNSSKDRSSNSKEYETMLTSLKEYYEKMVTKDKFDLVGAKDDLKKACLAYIKGKESLRSSEFGKERFDVVMSVLFDIMPRKEFAKILRQVNGGRGRDEKVNFDTYSVKSAELYSAEENREEERQVLAQKKYLTDIPKDYEEKFANVLNVYGLEPKAEGQLDDVFDEFNLSFGKVENKLCTIGKGLKERSLSNGDFAALAYAGTLSESAMEHDDRYRADDIKQYKLLATARDYTVALFGNFIPEKTGRYAEVIKAGREAAVEAMEEYAKGDKFLLASIISSGIRHIAAMARLSENVDDSFICNGEMGRRMLEMLDRDRELKSMVLNTSYQSINDDIAYIDTINQAAGIYTRAVESTEKLMSMTAEPELFDMNMEQKRELIADIMMLKVLDSSKEMYHKSVEHILATEPKYTKQLREIDKKYVQETEQVLKGKYSEEGTEKMLAAAKDNRDLRVTIVKDYLRNDKLFISLNTDKAVASLKDSVKKLVGDGGYDKLEPGEILKKLNDKKLLSKLAQITKTANDKSADVYAKRKAAEQKKRNDAKKKQVRK